MKRFKSLVLLLATVLMVATMLTPLAMASQTSERRIEVVVCPRCGGTCEVHENISGTKVGSCEHGTHYSCTVTYSCNSCTYRVTLTGHYCTGNGGHICIDGECSC